MVPKKIIIFKELALQEQTYELRGQGKKKKKDVIKSRHEPPLTNEKNYLQKFETIPLRGDIHGQEVC